MIEEFSLDTYLFFKSFKTDKMEKYLDDADPFYQELLFYEKLSEKNLVSCIIPNNLEYYNSIEKVGTSNLINLLNVLNFGLKKKTIVLSSHTEVFYENGLILFRRKMFNQDYTIKIEYGSDVFKYLVKSKSKNNKGILYEPI